MNTLKPETSHFSELSTVEKVRSAQNPNLALDALNPEPTTPEAVELHEELMTLLIKLAPNEFSEQITEEVLTHALQNPNEYAFLLMHGLSEKYSDRSIEGRVYTGPGGREQVGVHFFTKKPETYAAKELDVKITHVMDEITDNWAPNYMTIESDLRGTLPEGTTAELEYKDGEVTLYKITAKTLNHPEKKVKVDDLVEKLVLFVAIATDTAEAFEAKSPPDDVTTREQTIIDIYGER